MTRKRAARFAGAFLLLGLVGCGGGKTGDVQGKVSLNGKPLAMGTVTFIGADGTTKPGTIQSDGSYKVEGVAVGKAKILVDSPKPIVSNSPAAKAAEKGGGRGGRRTGPDDLPPDAPKVDRRPQIETVTSDEAKKWVAISPDYADPAKTNQSLDVKSGINEHNIELK